ncbi:MAG TPA: glycosyl hydrolase family 28-related protein [Acetobacteraceae bacterium]|nr:glycosyl hydrolase family 28-related protein [Acetobacteraceae bacterium]
MPNLQPNVVDVRRFGAAGDGIANDGPAINRAVRFLRDHQKSVGGLGFSPKLVFPTGAYAVEEPIDLTKLQALNAVVEGDSSLILGRCAGQPVIDALGSRWLTIRDLTIVGDKTATPKLGMQIGRLADGRVADNHRFSNVKLVGHYSLACLLNLASETVGFDHLFCWNACPDQGSYCLIQDGLNHFGTISAFVPDQRGGPEHDLSFNENEFINCDFRHSGGGVPVWLGDTSRHRFYRCYAATTGAASFVLYCGPNSHTMLDVDCHCESRGLRSVFLATGQSPSAVIRGFSYKDHETFASDFVFARREPLKHVSIQHAQIEIAGFFEPGCRLLDNPAGWRMTGKFYSSEARHWNADPSFTGTVFIGDSVYQLGAMGAVSAKVRRQQ